MKKAWLGPMMILGLLATACAGQPTASSNQTSVDSPPKSSSGTSAVSPNPAKGEEKKDWEKQLEETLAAAKKEGKLAVIGRPGTDREQFFLKFQERYPEIKIEYSLMRPSNLAPKLLSEQQNNRYMWDLMVEGGNNVSNVLAPAGAIANIRDYIIRDPNVVDDMHWQGGFEDGFKLADNLGMYSFGVSTSVGPWVNREFVSKAELNKLEDLLNPKWKGKIVINDPTVPAHGQIMLSSMAHLQGKDYIKKLMFDQQPVYLSDVRQMTEWLVTGKYPIAIGLDTAQLQTFVDNGVVKKVQTLRLDKANYYTPFSIAVLKNPPHPNASKIFVNWFLSKKGQEKHVEVVNLYLSRRTDAPEVKGPFTIPWSQIDTEKAVAEQSVAGEAKGGWIIQQGKQYNASLQKK